MFLSKVSFGSAAGESAPPWRRLSVVAIFLLATAADSGQFATSGFGNLSDSSHLLLSGSTAAIAVRETLFIDVFPQQPLTQTGNTSYSAEVLAVGLNTFAFCWAEDDGASNNVFARNVLLTENGADTTARARIFINQSQVSHLNASLGTSADSYLTAIGLANSVPVFREMRSVTVQDCMANNSICHFGADTFYVVYKVSNSEVDMRRVRLAGDMVEFADDDISLVQRVFRSRTSSPGGNFTNLSVAADSNGNILVLMTRGATNEAKVLEYKLTDSDFTSRDSGTVAGGVSFNTADNAVYTDAPLVSYARDMFAATHWNSSGVYLDKLDCSAIPVAVDASNTVVGGDSYQFSTLATNGEVLVLAWENTSAGRIEGKSFEISGTSILPVPSATNVFSSTSASIDLLRQDLNIAVDAAGSVALAWTQNDSAMCVVWAEKGIRHSTAFVVSEVESVAVVPGDSVLFLAGSVDQQLNGGGVSVTLQTGPSASSFAEWGSWSDVTSASDLAQNAKGTDRYFRIRTDMTRPLDSIVSPLLRSVTVNWNAKPSIDSLFSVSINGIRVRGTASPDSSFFGDTLDVIAEQDTVALGFSVHDGDAGDNSDSVFAAATWPVDPERACDTLSGSVEMQGTIGLSPRTVWDTVYTVALEANDAGSWVADPDTVYIRARKAAPVITSVTYDGALVADGDSVSVVLGQPVVIAAAIERQQIVAWNPIEYRLATKRPGLDTATSVSDFVLSPSLLDSSVIIVVSDAFGAADSLEFHLTYPRFEVDSVTNPGYVPARDTLAGRVSFIVGAQDADTVILPIMNTGNESLAIDSIFFSGGSVGWLRLGVPEDGAVAYYDSLTSTGNIARIALAADSTAELVFVFDAAGLRGDGVLRDTIYVFVSDPAHPVDTIPVLLEYNDLPTIIGVSFDFAPRPYWLSKRRAVLADGDYVFPPHAAVDIQFSEAMDSGSATGGIYAYSVLEEAARGEVDTIDFAQTWKNDSTVRLRPVYRSASIHFSGIFPDSGFFIPTDSVAIVVSSRLTDRATTPSGPNYLDLDGDFVIDLGSDTAIHARVDSIRFTLESVSPQDGQEASSIDPIVLTFSAPVWPGTIDPSLSGNRSLVITSKYLSSIDSSRQLEFSSIRTSGNQVTFVPGKRFFSGDSVFVHYFGGTARDTLGYPVDMDGDGIPISLFDPSSAADDYSWAFQVAHISCDSVGPADAATGVSINTSVELTFSDAIPPGTVDTSRTNNRTLVVTSRYSEGTRIDFDSVSVAGNKAEFFLDRRLFYSDSVHCHFMGLSTADTALFAVDPGSSGFLYTRMEREWYFVAEELSIVSVSPDSAATGAGTRTPISMTFSGPISPMIFDTTLDADSNVSFRVHTGYTGDAAMPIRQISFSGDSTTVTFHAQGAFFSQDSVICEFTGFAGTYSYVRLRSFLPVDTANAFGSYTWYFRTGAASFYTYPNPFKPGSNRRHKDLGGIWFKNLHVLRTGLSDVLVKVYDINTHPVFDSHQAGYEIHFEEGNPDNTPIWFWDTRNTKGNPLASGIYLYAICDRNRRDRILKKGKILLVR